MSWWRHMGPLTSPFIMTPLCWCPFLYLFQFYKASFLSWSSCYSKCSCTADSYNHITMLTNLLSFPFQMTLAWYASFYSRHRLGQHFYYAIQHDPKISMCPISVCLKLQCWGGGGGLFPDMSLYVHLHITSFPIPQLARSYLNSLFFVFTTLNNLVPNMGHLIAYLLTPPPDPTPILSH